MKSKGVLTWRIAASGSAILAALILGLMCLTQQTDSQSPARPGDPPFWIALGHYLAHSCSIEHIRAIGGKCNSSMIVIELGRQDRGGVFHSGLVRVTRRFFQLAGVRRGFNSILRQIC